MIWPWQRHRQEVEAASIEVASAERKNEVAEMRLQAVNRQAAQSRETTKVLQHQLDLNGWTEMLQEAWGRRA
jgi:hypothetical protein